MNARRLNDLIREMSLTEKIGQLNFPQAGGPTTTGAGSSAASIEQRIAAGDVGGLGAGAALEQQREWQRIAHEESAHGVPLLLTMDVIHGHRTIFPLPIALAGSFDADLIRRTARVAAREAAAHGISLAWAPMLDISRDARWGRCAESPGEDPHLACVYAQAMVEGMGTPSEHGSDHVLTCAKHFAGYGFSEAGRDYHEVDISPYRMHNSVLPPFQAAVEAGVKAVMVGFHSLSGIPCTAHRELLHGLLREQWGFDGVVVSDYTAIMELQNHGVAADAEAATLLAFDAGVDIDLVSEYYATHLPALVDAGRVTMDSIDTACRRVLKLKLDLGLFSNPYRGLDEARRSAVTRSVDNLALAREAATSSCVLLKNDGVLPLQSDSKVALIGPLADDRANLQGTWAVAGRAAESVSIRDALIAARRRFDHARGANIVDDPNIAARLNVFGESVTIDPRPQATLTEEAVAVASQADVIVACVGEAKEHTGESASRTSLGLPGSQQQLVDALAAIGKPLVLITMSGRPLVLERANAQASAILHAWFAGSESGPAIADLLYGVVVPSGRLAMSFPRSVGQCPIHYAEPPTGRPIDGIGLEADGDQERSAAGEPVFVKFTTANRLEGPHTPLYPFGYGLGYSTIRYSAPRVDKRTLHGWQDTLRIWVEVSNTGRREAIETVQLYVSDPVASRSRPRLELRAFRRVPLDPGTMQRVEFSLTADDVSYVEAVRLAQPVRVREAGRFVIRTGPNSAELQSVTVNWLMA